MRFMIMVMGNEDSEAGVMPSEDQLAEMGTFNEKLIQAGVMKGGEGLHPTSKAIRVDFSGNERTLTDGPFTEAKEIVAGYWIWETDTLEETIEWVKGSPFQDGSVQIRPIFGAEDFGDELTPELRAQEDSQRERLEAANQ